MNWNIEDPLQATKEQSKRAYAAFHDYILMGAHRSLRRLLEEYRKQPNPPTKSWKTISLWSMNHDWVARAERFDVLTRQRAEEAYEAHWREKVMGSTEVLGRLSEQARVNIADFVTVKLVPTALIIPLKKDEEGDESEEPAPIEQDGFVQVVELNWDAIREKGHLVKSITNTKHGPRIELHDGQSALINVGRTHKLFTDTINGFIERKNSPEDNERADKLNQSLSELSQAIGEMLSGTGAKPDSQVVSGE